MKTQYLIYFDTEKDFLYAYYYLENIGVNINSTLTPFYIENMSHKKKSNISKYTFAGGIIGLLFSFLLILWLGTYDYPLNTGGKPLFFLPSSIPLIFSLTVLFSAISSFIGFLFKTELPKWHIPNDLIVKAESELSNKFCILFEIESSYSQRIIEELKANTNLSGFYFTE